MGLLVLPMALLAQIVTVPVGVVLDWQRRRTEAVTWSWDDCPPLASSS